MYDQSRNRQKYKYSNKITGILPYVETRRKANNGRNEIQLLVEEVHQ